MAQYLMALDQGTTSSRCVIFDKRGAVAGVAQKEFAQYFPKPGWVEHDPLEIWASQSGVMAEAAARAGCAARDIAAIGITNQRETAIIWDRETGVPVYNAIVWQCRRTAGYCDALKARGFDKTIKAKTGLVPDAYFSATKIRWILENVPGTRERAEKGELAFGTVDTWLIWKLTGGRVHATDYTNASRTMLFNIHTLQWDGEILRELGIPESLLPEVRPSSGAFGTAELLGGQAPIAGAAGDQQAALFGQCCFEPGMVKNTYGTGCFILMNTGSVAVESRNGLLTTIAWGLRGRVAYALEGSVFSAGAAIQWLRDGLQIIDSASESEEYCESVSDTAGVYVVPAFTGLGAPYWDQYARGTITGLTRGAGKAHLIRAAVESLAYQSADVIKAMEADAGTAVTVLRADGGASANNFLMQFQADILGTPVVRPRVIEATAQGAAYLAGLASGYYKDQEDILRNTGTGRTFAPGMDEPGRAERLAGWRKAVGRSLGWAK